MISDKLQSLLRIFNEVDAQAVEDGRISIEDESTPSTSIVLLVSGFMVSGTIITIREYHSLMKKNAQQSPVATKLMEGIFPLPVKFPEDPKEGETIKPEDDWPQIIYLKNATIIGSGNTRFNLPNFSISLDDISGWVLGSI